MLVPQSTPSRSNSKSNSHHTINKLLQKDLKEMIFSLDPNQLITFFRNLQIESKINSTKEFTKIGLKCSQCHTVFENYQAKGYGRDQHQALVNSIKIVIEQMIAAGNRLQAIKKALKHCTKYRQPLIPHYGINASSAKKSMKKVEGTVENIKMTKRHLQYGQSPNKQNIARKINQRSNEKRMNETLDLNSTLGQEKIALDSKQIKIGQKKALNILKAPQQQSKLTPVSTPQTNSNIDSSNVTQKQKQSKCSQFSNPKDCIFYELHQNSNQEIKNLNARIKLLEEENSMLKQLLLKDFNKEFFGKKKQATGQTTQ